MPKLMTRWLSIFVLSAPLVPLVVCLGCTTLPDRGDLAAAANPTREPAHITDQPIRSGLKWQWVDAPLALQTVSYQGKGKPFPSSNAVAQRLQFWIDTIDHMMRQRYPQLLANVPLPKAYLIDSKDVNAFQGAVSVCYENPVYLPKFNHAAGGSTIAPAFSLTNDLTNAFKRDFRSAFGNYAVVSNYDDSSCAHRTVATLDEAQSLANWVNANVSSCHLSAQQNAGEAKPSFALDGNCQLAAADRSQATSAQRLIVPAVSNWIMVLRGLVEKFSNEDQVIFILAHEMSHYYRAHMVAPASDYQFYYQQSTISPGDRARPHPPQDPAIAKQLNAVGSFIQRNARAFRGFQRSAGQHYHPAIFDAIEPTISLAMKTACAPGTNCQAPCQDALVARSLFAPNYPHVALSADESSRLLSYEAKVQACAQAIAIIDGTESKPEALDQFSAMGQGATTSSLLSPLSLPRDASGVLIVHQLDEVFEYFNTFATAADAKLSDSYQQAEQLTLGLYSFEQEADEMGNEILYHLGMPSRTAVDSILTLDLTLEKMFGAPYPPALSAAACTVLCQNDWRDPGTGQTPFIHMGDFVDPHHTGCYRAYHFVQENEIHSFANGSAPNFARPPGPTWAELVKSLPSN